MIRLILYRMVTRSVLVAGVCLAVIGILFPGSSSGAPFLVSDPYPAKAEQPTLFVIIAGGLWYIVPAEKLPHGGVRLRFDLSQLPDGENTLEIRAINDGNHKASPSVSLKVVKTGNKVTIPKEEPPAPPKKQQKVPIPPTYIPRGMIKPPTQ